MFQERVIEQKNFTISFFTVIKGLLVAMKPPLRQAVFRLFGSLWKGYYQLQFKSRGKATDVCLYGVDDNIPFHAKALGVYMSLFTEWLAILDFMYGEFGNAVLPDLAHSIDSLSGLTLESGKVYENAQTTCKRVGQGGILLGLLRLFDKEQNYAPSLHVAFAAHIEFTIRSLLDRYGRNGYSYGLAKNFIFNQSVKIIESTLLIKQHCVRDVALALFMVAATDPEFSDAEAYELIAALFQKEGYRMEQGFVIHIRETIADIYKKVFAAWKRAEKPDPSVTAIAFIKSL